jgi:hypothetical protein
MSWSQAYARQALVDLETRDWLLSNPRLPESQQLHMLQMAAEKLCKAHLAARGTPAADLRTSHAFIAKPLPMIVRQYLAREVGKGSGTGWILSAIKLLARRIELLHPQVDDAGAVPANCEYPWLGPDGNAIAPGDHQFSLTLLHERAGTTLLKVMRIAIGELLDQENKNQSSEA